MKSGIHLTTKAGKYQNTYLVCAKENEPTFASTERYGMRSRRQMSLRSEVRSPLVSRGGDRDSRHADPDVLNLRLPPLPPLGSHHLLQRRHWLLSHCLRGGWLPWGGRGCATLGTCLTSHLCPTLPNVSRLLTRPPLPRDPGHVQAHGTQLVGEAGHVQRTRATGTPSPPTKDTASDSGHVRPLEAPNLNPCRARPSKPLRPFTRQL